METKALLFSVDVYDRFGELENKTSEELIALATKDETSEDEMILSLPELEQMVNDEELDLNGWWLYFVKY